MRRFRVGALQWAVGLYCVSIGTLMLITPHQFGSRTFVPLQPVLPQWGAALFLAGSALLYVAIFAPQRWFVIGTHMISGVMLLSLAYAFTTSRAWTGTTSYLVLGVGTCCAPFVAVSESSRPGVQRDLFSLMMATVAIVTGLVLVAVPPDTLSPVYTVVIVPLAWHGAFLVIGGALLLAVVMRAPYHQRLLALAHVLAGAAYLAFCISFAIPNRGFSAIALYGGFGSLLLFLPWLDPPIRRINPARLRTRLAFALTALAAIPLVLGTAIITSQEEQEAIELSLGRQQGFAVALAEHVSTYVGLHQAAVVDTAAELAAVAPTPEEHRERLLRVSSAYPQLVTFASYDANGSPIARSDGRTSGLPIGDLPIFIEARTTLRPGIEIRIARSSGQPVLTLGAPIRDDTGQFAGMVIGSLEMARLAATLQEASPQMAGTIYLVDQEGRVIVHPDAAADQIFAPRPLEPPVAALLALESAGSIEYTSDNGKRLAGFARIPELGWGVVVDTPSERVLAGVHAGRELALSVLILVITVAIAISLILARVLSVPLAALVQTTRQLAEGSRKTLPLPRSGVYEVAELADTVRDLRAALDQRTAERDQAELRLRLLADAGSALSESLDLPTTLTNIARLVVPRLADWCLVDMIMEDGSIALLVAEHAEPTRIEHVRALRQRFPLDPGAASGPPHVLRTGRPELYGQVTSAELALLAHAPEERRLFEQAGLRSALIVPLIARGHVLGTISLFRGDTRDPYNADDLRLMEDLARRAALAVDNAQLYAAEQQARRAAERATVRTARLQAVTAALSQAPTPELVADVVMTEGTSALGADAGILAIVTPEGDALEIVRAAGYPPELIAAYQRLPIDISFPLVEVVRTGEPIFVSSREEGLARFPQLEQLQRQTALHAWANIPLVIDQQVIGALDISFLAPRTFSADDRAFLQTLGQQCAQALERARLYVAEQAARARAEASVQIRDQFLSIAAHELKTPLTPLLGQAQLMERRARRNQQLMSDQDRRALGIIVSQANRLNQLITSLLDLQRLHAQRLTLRLTRLDLCAFVGRLVDELQPTLTHHAIQVEAPEQPLMLTADALRLEQVLQNLLSNAIKYSPQGGASAGADRSTRASCVPSGARLGHRDTAGGLAAVVRTLLPGGQR